MDLSSKVNLPHVINFKAVCSTDLVTLHPEFRAGGGVRVRFMPGAIHHTLDYRPFIKGQLASRNQLVVQIWSRHTENSVQGVAFVCDSCPALASLDLSFCELVSAPSQPKNNETYNSQPLTLNPNP